MSVNDNSISDYFVKTKPKLKNVNVKNPKESISNIIHKKNITASKRESLHSVDRVLLKPEGRGKYKNDTIDKILKKRKYEINKSISFPNNIIPEEKTNEIEELPTKKVTHRKLYQAKETPVR